MIVKNKNEIAITGPGKKVLDIICTLKLFGVPPRDSESQIHYHTHLCSSKTTLHKIYRNKEYRSRLVLPIVNPKQTVIDYLSDENLLGALENTAFR